MAEGGRRSRKGLARTALLLVALVVLVAAGMAVHGQARRAFLDDTTRRGEATLRLAVASLDAQLLRFERLPRLIAEQDLVRRLAADPGDPALVRSTTRYLRGIAATLGANDV